MPTIGYAAIMGQFKTSATTDPENDYAGVRPEDVIRYGINEQLVGRFPVIAALKRHNVQDLALILTKERDSLEEKFKDRFADDNIKLEFTDDGRRAIAERAFQLKMGGRSLQAVLEKVLEEYAFDTESYVGQTLTIDAALVEKTYPMEQQKQAVSAPVLAAV